MREKALAARPPANSPPLAVVSGPGAPPTLASLGQQLREVLPARRLHSVSVWDGEANVVWLSEGALGPDEQTVVVAALEVLADDPSVSCHEDGLEDGRYALFLPVRSPTSHLVGVAMILADCKSVGEDTLERLALAPVRAIMQRLAVLLKPRSRRTPADSRASDAEPADLPDAVLPLLELVQDIEPQREPPVRRSPAPTAARPPKTATGPAAASARDVITPEQVADILEFEFPPESVPPLPARTNGSAAHSVSDSESDMVSLEFLPAEPPVAPAVPAVLRPAPTAAAAPSAPPIRRAAPATQPAPSAARASVVQAPSASKREAVPSTPAGLPTPATAAAPQSDANLTLEVLPYAKLRPGGQSRRFQIQARLSARIAQADPAVLDVLILQRLVGWLAAHRAVWNSQPTSFTVTVSIATLEDEHFALKVAGELNARGIAAKTVGFEITEALCTQRRAQVERFLAHCDKLGTPVVIDDFSFDSQAVPLLRSKAVRMVKIDPRLSASAVRDKLSQALVIATVQAAKVLGIHCAAKRVDTHAAAQWLGAIGCDFGQGAAFPNARPLESLAASPDAAALTTLINRPPVDPE